VRDLFYATPARLKFLKSPRTETEYAADAVARLAMAHPGIAFTFSADGKEPRRFDAAVGDLWDARLVRLAAVMGRDFAENSLRIEAAREGYRVTGYIGLPTLNRANAQGQYLFVDGRPVRDKLLLGALRAAYQDFLARDRHPMVALFFEAEPELVDVNVHPAKAEVRFRDSGLVRGLVIGAIKHALASAGHRAATTPAASALGAFRGAYVSPQRAPGRMFEDAARFQAPLTALDSALAPAARPESQTHGPPQQESRAGLPLGLARAQLHQTYIVAETADGIVIVDQHAAHERLTHERLKSEIESGKVPRQVLLIPEVVELEETAASRLATRAEEFARLGLMLESFGAGAVVVREIPAALMGEDIAGLVRDLADELGEESAPLSLKDRLLHVCATRACHGSIRAGRVLSGAEMNALLRQMETTPHAGQCSHGRPTYVELKLADIEKLFGRR
jgi:DNA mismatch repair protein MutL